LKDIVKRSPKAIEENLKSEFVSPFLAETAAVTLSGKAR
jgi:hypothetical protein